ncbi:MAG: ribosome maturation factor RimM [Anaerolineae bacterium]
MRGEAYQIPKGEDRGSGTEATSPEPSYLIIGRILGAWGREGAVKVEIMTDFPQRFARLRQVYLGESCRPCQVEWARSCGRHAILKLEGCLDRESAISLRGQLVHVPTEEAIPLGEDEYYVYQILGLVAWTKEGRCLGRIQEVLFTGSNEVYVARQGEVETLIPAIEDVVLEVDLAGKRLIVDGSFFEEDADKNE